MVALTYSTPLLLVPQIKWDRSSSNRTSPAYQRTSTTASSFKSSLRDYFTLRIGFQTPKFWSSVKKKSLVCEGNHVIWLHSEGGFDPIPWGNWGIKQFLADLPPLFGCIPPGISSSSVALASTHHRWRPVERGGPTRRRIVLARGNNAETWYILSFWSIICSPNLLWISLVFLEQLKQFVLH